MKFNFIILITLLCCCSCSEKQEKPKTAMDTARVFIRSSFNGDFENAETLLYEDSINKEYFKRFEKFYTNLPQSEKVKYKNSDYQINNYTEINDSVTLIKYSNDYMKKSMELKVVKKDQLWFIDFKSGYSEK